MNHLVVGVTLCFIDSTLFKAKPAYAANSSLSLIPIRLIISTSHISLKSDINRRYCPLPPISEAVFLWLTCWWYVYEDAHCHLSLLGT